MSEELSADGPKDVSGVRASDAERDALADELRAHAIAGRLDTDELEERLQGAYQARTTGELRALRRDLPALPASPEQLALEHRQRRAQLVRRSVQETGGSLSAFGVCTVIWIASGAHSFFWPVFVLLAVAATVARSLWDLYGPGADLDAVQARLDARRDHHEQQADHHAARHQHRAARHERRGRF
jgi:hypothetical protein